MKAIHSIYMLIVLAAATLGATAQNYPEEYLGLPGDNLNLYAVMNLFQESETLEKFEQNLNSEELMINNLDMNGDNLIDYITVSDYVDGNVHSIVLRAALNRKEQQDVAVFVVEQLSNGAVQIQLIGDEALYGPNYIVEPIYAETANPGYRGKTYRNNVNVVTTSYYDIAAWPVVRFIYRPGYNVWRSSWYWGYYPTYWNPWRAHYWHYYYGYHYNWHDHYYTHYRHWDNYRCMNYNTYYRNNVRVYSPTVVANINKGQYRNTYSRPDQRRAGENYYAQTANSRSETAAYRQSAQRTGTSATRTSSNVSTTGRNTNAVRETSSSQRTNSPQRVATKQPVNRSSAVKQTQPGRGQSSVKQTQPVRSSTVQRSQPGNSQSSVQRSSSAKSAPSVQRSNSSTVQRSQSTVQRSQPGKSQSSVQRSSTVQQNQPGRSQSSVQQTQPGKSQSTVQRSQPGKSQSTVQRSQPGKSPSSVKSSSSSSSRKSGDSRSSSSSSQRR